MCKRCINNHENKFPISVFVQTDPPVVYYSVSPLPQYQSDQGQKVTLHSCLGQELNLFRGTPCLPVALWTLYLFGGRGREAEGLVGSDLL